MLSEVSSATTVTPDAAADAPEFRNGPRKRERQQQERGHPQRQQQQLAQMALLRVFDRRRAQQFHRGKLDVDLRLPLQQVQHDRNRRRHGSDEEERREKSHQNVRPSRRQIRQQRQLQRLIGVSS